MKQQKDFKELSRLATRLGHITGFGISLVTPMALLVWGAWYLMERHGVGTWIMAAAIVCGLLSGGMTFYNFVSAEIRRANREGEEYLRKQAERGSQRGEDNHEA